MQQQWLALLLGFNMSILLHVIFTFLMCCYLRLQVASPVPMQLILPSMKVKPTFDVYKLTKTLSNMFLLFLMFFFVFLVNIKRIFFISKKL